MIKMEDFDRLYAIVNYETGDSWNGTHDRWIEVSFPDDYSIQVRSCSPSTGERSGVFSAEDVINCYEKLSMAAHYQDFMDAWSQAEQNSQKAKAEGKAAAAEIPIEVKLEMLAVHGTSQPTPAHKKMVLVKGGRPQSR